MILSKKKESWSKQGYILFVVLSLVMYIFGHSTESGTLPFPDRLFYIPCGISLALAVINSDFWSFSRSDRLFVFFYFISFVYSALFIGLEAEDMITCILGFLVFRYLSQIRVNRALSLLSLFTPVIVAIHYVYSSPLSLSVGQRYGGFQGDPNCFSFAMNLLIYSCGFVINFEKRVFYKILAVLSIIGIIPLIMAAASRAGVAIMAVLLVYIFKDTLKRNKILSLLVLVVVLAYGGRAIVRLNSQLATITSRYDDMRESGEDYRMAEFTMVPKVLSAHPEYWLFGIGYSQSLKAHSKFPEYYHEGRAHNTYMSVLLEEGIVGFILFLLFLINIGKTAFKNKVFEDGRYRILLFFVTVFFIFTIYSLPFLPFWFAVGLITNKYDIELV